MELKYDFIPDELGDDAHAHQLRAVPPGSRVLELGCATGYVSKLLVERHGCRVTGVDVSAEALERAAAFCERVLTADLDATDLAHELAGERYDVVLAGDVLEHLKDPGRVLAQVRGLLTPGGQVVATIPNVAHADVRLALTLGRFDYRRLGLLDETHLRFFTRESVLALFTDAGYVVTALSRIRKPLFASELELTPDLFPEELVRWVALDPEATTYQFVVVARPQGEPAALPDDGANAARQALLDELEVRRGLPAELQALIETKDRELAAEHERLEAAVGRFHELEGRYQAMRRVSWLNPLVVAPALWRRLRGKGNP